MTRKRLALATALKQAVDALRRFGQHAPNCPANAPGPGTYGHRETDCGCGLHNARMAAEKHSATVAEIDLSQTLREECRQLRAILDGIHLPRASHVRAATIMGAEVSLVASADAVTRLAAYKSKAAQATEKKT